MCGVRQPTRWRTPPYLGGSPLTEYGDDRTPLMRASGVSWVPVSAVMPILEFLQAVIEELSQRDAQGERPED